MPYNITNIHTQQIDSELSRFELSIDFENIDEAVNMSQEIVKFVTRNFQNYERFIKNKENYACNTQQ